LRLYQDIHKFKGYGPVGLSLGASAGCAGDVALGLTASSPQKHDGPFAAVMLEGVAGIGGGIGVTFDIPDLNF
jgi:hypothetical protein